MRDLNPYEAPQTVERPAATVEPRPAKTDSGTLPYYVKALMGIQVAAALLGETFYFWQSTITGPWVDRFQGAALTFGLLYLLLTFAMIVLMTVLRSSYLLGFQLIIFMVLFLLGASIEAGWGHL